jgi:hypothetical protein
VPTPVLSYTCSNRENLHGYFFEQCAWIQVRLPGSLRACGMPAAFLGALPSLCCDSAFANAAEAILAPVLDVYVFNVTNADAVLTGAAPSLQLVGPVSFAERHAVTHVAWELGGDIIRYTPALELQPCTTSGAPDVTWDSSCAPAGPPPPLPTPLGPSAPLTLDSTVVTVNMPWLLAESNGLWGDVTGGAAGTPLFRAMTVRELL